MQIANRDRLESFVKNDDQIIHERMQWYLIRLQYMTPRHKNIVKYIHINKTSIYNYVRLHYLLGEPL